jgi:hypothetical protein
MTVDGHATGLYLLGGHIAPSQGHKAETTEIQVESALSLAATAAFL